MPLIPIDQLITIPEGVAITPEQLRLADLSTIPHGIVLLTVAGNLKVLISGKEQLVVKSSYTVRGDDPLAKRYGVKNTAAVMDQATGLIPSNEAEAATLPRLTSAGWKLPDEVYWEFRLPIITTGDELLAEVRAVGEFIIRTTEELLAAAGEPPYLEAAC